MYNSFLTFLSIDCLQTTIFSDVRIHAIVLICYLVVLIVACLDSRTRLAHYTDRYVAASIPKCGGCQEVILDKYVLRVLERCWHARCLTCRDCGARLTDKCFARNGHVFCKDDFFK